MFIVKAIVVDDDRAALNEFKQLLENETVEVEVVATYANVSEAVAGVMRHYPDVVFLLRSRADKPVRGKENGSDSAPMVCFFRQIRFQLPGKDPWEVKWRTSKVQELFAYLLHYRNRTIDRGVLLDLLWPDWDRDKAAKQLYTTIYHIRNTLKSCGMDTIAIQNAAFESGYRLDTGAAKVDAEEWESALSRLDAPDERTAAAYEQVLMRYEGDYLGDCGYLWAEHERERYRQLWLHYVRELSELYEGNGMMREAVRWYRRVQQILPEAEDSYAALIRLYRLLGDGARAEEQATLLKTRIDGES